MAAFDRPANFVIRGWCLEIALRPLFFSGSRGAGILCLHSFFLQLVVRFSIIKRQRDERLAGIPRVPFFFLRCQRDVLYFPLFVFE